MKNHKWIPEKAGDRYIKWTHYCERCFCRRGRELLPGFGTRRIWRRRETNALLTVRPDCNDIAAG